MKITENVKFGIGAVAAVVSGIAVSEAINGACGDKSNVITKLGSAIAGSVAGAGVGSEVLKITNTVCDYFEDKPEDVDEFDDEDEFE